MEVTKGDKIKLRAELAGKAMQGLVSNYEWMVAARDGRQSVANIVAECSVECADALMKELGLDGE